MSLFRRIGSDRMKRIDRLNAAGKILEVHHEEAGTCLVLKSGERLTLEGLDREDSRRMVGYLGLFGQGESGMEPPAYLQEPAAQAEASATADSSPRAIVPGFSSLTSILGAAPLNANPSRQARPGRPTF